MPVAVAEAELVKLAAIVDAPATWPMPASPPASNLMSQFTRLDVDVRMARTRRIIRTWFTFATSAVLGIFVGFPLVTKVVEGVSAGL